MRRNDRADQADVRGHHAVAVLHEPRGEMLQRLAKARTVPHGCIDALARQLSEGVLPQQILAQHQGSIGVPYLSTELTAMHPTTPVEPTHHRGPNNSSPTLVHSIEP